MVISSESWWVGELILRELGVWGVVWILLLRALLTLKFCDSKIPSKEIGVCLQRSHGPAVGAGGLEAPVLPLSFAHPRDLA